MRFDPISYLLGELNNSTSRLHGEDFSDREVFIVGSGPSIDKTNLSLISDSKVILLNSAYQLAPRFGSNNQFYWFCQDTRALLSIGPNVPSSMKKIITIHRFNRMWQVKAFLGKEDIYLQPKLCLEKPKRKSGRWSSLALKPKFKSNGPLLHNTGKNRIELLPSTVMLTAISIFGGLGASRITCLGFDLTPPNASEARVSGYVDQPYQTGKLPIDKIEEFLKGLRKEMEASGQELVNGSPMTHESVLRKVSQFGKYG